MKQPSIIETVRAAWADPDRRQQAMAAHTQFLEYAPNLTGRSRVPGMDTPLRLAVRIHRGKTVEEAASKEYLYRWNLFLASMINHLEAKASSRPYSIWPAPHVWGL
jgi:hypothetical protein